MNEFLIALALLITTGAFALALYGGQRRSVAPLLTITMVVHIFLWYALPLALQQLLGLPVEDSPAALSRPALAVLQGALLLIITIFFLAVRNPYIGPVRKFFDECAPSPHKLLWPTTAALVILVFVEIGQARIMGSSFAEAQAFTVTAGSADLAQNALLGTMLSIVVGYVIALLTLGRSAGVSRTTLLLAWITLLVFCAFSISRGVRAVVLLPVVAGIVTISTLHGHARRRAIAALVIFGGLTTAVGGPVAAIMGVARGSNAEFSPTLVVNAYNTLFAGSTLGDQATVLLSEVNRKFDAVGPGIELLAMEPPGFGGVQPLLSAGIAPVPRLLYPTKPVPMSRDGTYTGTPYRIAAKAYGDPELGMVVPVSATAVSIWEFGVLGPLLFVLANVLSLVFLNTVFVTRNVFARAIGVSMLGLPNAEFFLASPSLLLVNSLRMALYLVLLALAWLFWRMLKHARAGQLAHGEYAHGEYAHGEYAPMHRPHTEPA